MKFFDTVLILSGLMITSSALAKNQWVIPYPYQEEMVILDDKHVHFLETEGDDIIYIYATKQQMESNETSLWMTKCFRDTEKGIPITSCLIQFPWSSSISILVNPHKTQVIFSPLKSKEVNYRVDKKAIKSLNNSYNNSYLLNKNLQSKILQDLLNGKKIIYSYKLDTEYKTIELPIENLKNHYEFSKAFIKAN